MTRPRRFMPLMTFILLNSSSWETWAFVSGTPASRWGHSVVRQVVPNTILAARASKRKKKKVRPSRATSGGFGKVTRSDAPDVMIDNDYSVFPALEPDVQDTLIPWSDETSDTASPGVPQEITDRLAQIYGFRRFNYAPSQEEVSTVTEVSTMSFEDLLTSTNTKNDKSDLDNLLNPPSKLDSLGDLLATATSEPRSGKTTYLPLSSLGPFEKCRVLHVDPLVVSIDDFFSEDVCDKYIAMSESPSIPKGGPMQIRSRTVGKDYAAKAQRTSTTWFHHYKDVPELMAKASRLLGLDDINCWEEPQTVRYRRTEKFTWHLDALAPGEKLSDESGGQRTATLLVYLADLTSEEGGATMFRDLGGSEGPLKVRPKKGSAVLFFPAAGGINNCPFDIRTLHCGEAVSADAKNDKWIAQLWLRQSPYTPTAPSGNSHDAATQAISDFCASSS